MRNSVTRASRANKPVSQSLEDGGILLPQPIKELPPVKQELQIRKYKASHQSSAAPDWAETIRVQNELMKAMIQLLGDRPQGIPAPTPPPTPFARKTTSPEPKPETGPRELPKRVVQPREECIANSTAPFRPAKEPIVEPPRVVSRGAGGRRLLFQCPKCSERLVVRLKHSGRICQCHACASVFSAPVLEDGVIKRPAHLFEQETGLILLRKQASGDAAARRSRQYTTWIPVAAAVVMLAPLAMSSVNQPKQEAHSIKEELPEVEYGEEATRVVRAFLAADGWEAKSRYVRDPERVKPLMWDYYERQGHDAGSSAYSAMTYSDVQTHSFGFATEVSLEIDNKPARGFSVEHGPTGPKIEWESQVIYNPIPWEEFVSGESKGAAVFRVAARRASYFNFGFNDSAKYICVEFGLPQHQGLSTFGYVLAESPEGRRVQEALALVPPGEWLPLMLELERPADKHSPDQVVIKRFARSGWRIDDPPPVRPDPTQS